jgi:hypothetical protein
VVERGSKSSHAHLQHRTSREGPGFASEFSGTRFALSVCPHCCKSVPGVLCYAISRTQLPLDYVRASLRLSERPLSSCGPFRLTDGWPAYEMLTAVMTRTPRQRLRPQEPF